MQEGRTVYNSAIFPHVIRYSSISTKLCRSNRLYNSNIYQKIIYCIRFWCNFWHDAAMVDNCVQLESKIHLLYISNLYPIARKRKLKCMSYASYMTTLICISFGVIVQYIYCLPCRYNIKNGFLQVQKIFHLILKHRGSIPTKRWFWSCRAWVVIYVVNRNCSKPLVL